MNFFKKVIIISGISCFLFIPFLVVKVDAQANTQVSNSSLTTAINTNKELQYGLKGAAEEAGLPDSVGGKKSIFEVIGALVQGGLSLMALAFFALTLYAGILWMIARGDSARVDKSKQILEEAFIGLIIIVSAYAIVNFVFKGIF